MKKLLVTAGAAVVALVGIGASAAQAASVTVCHSISITVNDQNVSDSACNVLPPQ